MTKEKPNFLESIKFEEEFLPFKEGTEINFGGEDEVQRMIEFYLKDKKIKDSDGKIISAKDNAERFKINCVLGNNGGGKSRLFEWIHGFLQNPRIDMTPSGEKYQGIIYLRDNKISFPNKNFIPPLPLYSLNNDNSNKNLFSLLQEEGVGNYKLILDDFFKLSGNNYFSINRGLLNKENLNNLYCDIYNNLNEKFGQIFSHFFNINIRNTSLLLSKKIDRELVNNLKLQNYKYFEENDFLTICNTINYSGYIIFDIYEKLQDEEILKYFYFSIIKNIFFLINSPLYKKNESAILAKEDLLCNLQKIEKILSMTDKHSDKVETFINSGGKENNEKLSDFIMNNYDEGKVCKIHQGIIKMFKRGEIEVIDKLFSLDIILNDVLEFNNISAGEKMILIRFINIFTNIQSSYLSGNKKTDFLILIDEPDLHLHLDWQRQYIQKLIDVFSTLDPEINLHFIIATHSPFIISDLPTECMVVLDKSEKNIHEGKFVEVKEYSKRDEKGDFIHQTFGANYIDIIKNGFFFEDKMLMGSFAQNIIGDIAKDERTQFCSDEGKISSNLIEKNIGDDFLKDNLLYFKPKK